MKPLNLDNSPCTPTSSNCVIWQGPNIPCIKLCTGDTISDVVAKLATELCTILDYLKVDNYDLSCFNLATCPPTNFQELTQFLIDRICALENIDPATVTSTTTISTTAPAGGSKSPLVSDYLMTANVVFGGGTIKLVDYVNEIAAKISTILVDITIINTTITNLDTRVTVLETTPPPVFTLPDFVLGCDIGTIIPVLATGSTQFIDIVLERFINEEWCPYKVVLDTYSNIANAVLSQPILGTDPAEALKYSAPGTQMQVAYPSYVPAPGTLADAINNLWIALDDTRNAGVELVTVTAGDNITVTPVVSVVGANQVTDYTIAGKEAIVAAGTNVTVTSATVGNDTTYTVNGKDSIVVGADDIVVTPVTVGNTTTYTVSRPKETYYAEASGLVNVSLDATPSVYHFPLGYNTLSYTNTTGATKTFSVHISYLADINSTAVVDSNEFYCELVGGIVTTVLAVDTLQYESNGGRTQVLASLFDGPTNADVVNFTTAETVVTTPSTNAVEFRYTLAYMPKHVSFFKMITLNNNETVSLKFRSNDSTKDAYLRQAQILVQEI